MERLGDDFSEFSAVLESIADTNSASVYGDTGSAVMCSMSGPPEEPVSLGFEPRRKFHSLLTPSASVAQKHFPARLPVSAQTEIPSLLASNAAVARKYFSSSTAHARLLAPNASL